MDPEMTGEMSPAQGTVAHTLAVDPKAVGFASSQLLSP